MVTLDSDDFVRKSVTALDEKLYVPAVEFVVSRISLTARLKISLRKMCFRSVL
jgi:hypothetical protein